MWRFKHGTTYAFPSCAISESKIIIALIMLIFLFRFLNIPETFSVADKEQKIVQTEGRNQKNPCPVLALSPVELCALSTRLRVVQYHARHRCAFSVANANKCPQVGWRGWGRARWVEGKKGEVKGGERVWALAGSLGSGPERGLAHSSATSPVSD